MSLKDTKSISKPIPKRIIINNHEDLTVQLVDYYRCLDTIDFHGDDDEDDNGDNDDEDEDEDEDEDDEDSCDGGTNLYSKEKQKELSLNHPMLIKAYGILETGHSITINLQGFEPFFYIKIPDTWTSKECHTLVNGLKSAVYYRYKEHLVSSSMVKRKPFKEFTANDTFKFMKLQFKNKESYDQYSYKLANPLIINGLNKGKPYKYDLYESNIDPIIKFIHLTKINPSGWIKIPAKKYQLLQQRTSMTNFEVKINWEHIIPYDKLESAPINILAFDIEADSSHGDFPIGIKNYQKLSQELVTLFNDCGLQTKKTKVHPLFQKNPLMVIITLLKLVFDNDFHANNIHQIHTVNNLKPNPETVQQLGYTIHCLSEDLEHKLLTNNDVICQLTDLFEYNLPPIDSSAAHNSHYGLLAEEITAQLIKLARNNNARFRENPLSVIIKMVNLAFDDYFDGFMISNIYTKNNIKPKPIVLESMVPTVLTTLQDCANFVHCKRIPIHITAQEKDNLSQDYFVNQLTELFNTHLPLVEGDKLIQIGSTFQLTGQTDCYLKHIICLQSCEPITNEEMIMYENKGIYLPAEELANDLVMYEQQLGQPQEISKDELTSLIKNKVKEIKTWDIPYRKEQCQKAAEYRRFKQSSTDHAKVVVEFYNNEKDILLAWKQLVLTNDPDVVIGYNIFGFDFKFLYERSIELNCSEEFCQLGRLKNCTELFYEQKLSSAGLGDNTLRYIPMNGRVIIDLYKVVQKDYRLDSYKLDNVCHKFLYKEKVDLPPREIFSLQKGNSTDRKKIATYCLVDCILCNRLALKLEIISNNMAMAKVCKVPFPYLFLRGQGVKIFSLVSDYCSKEGYLVPVLPKADPSNDEKYEGAIVLTPETGIFFDPIAVGDFNSLYPSSMISENISHDSFVEIGGQYDNLPGFEYSNIEYDIYKNETVPGTKRQIKKKVAVQVCRYAQLPDGKKSVLPSILMELLAARKNARKKLEEETDQFKKNLWNGLQLAYKVTANSLYGQCGAKTSPINKVEIAASTTAVGRRMITFSKKYIEKAYKDQIVTLELKHSGTFDMVTKQMIPSKYTGMTVHVKDSYCVYGDTDSVFIRFNVYNLEGVKYTGLEAISLTIALCKKAAEEISSQLKRPQNIEFEKAIYPFILISKKRYHGHYYTKIDSPSFYPNSMGIALKRRDNAPIVKHIFGGGIDIIMNEHNVEKGLSFVKNECQKLLRGEFPLTEFIISKTLKSYYKKPRQIAHNVLACRQAQRDPGNRFEPNDRVPYAFVVNSNAAALQGDKIETPEFIKQNKLLLDYKMYITNQIMKPVAQIFELVPGYEKTEDTFKLMIDRYENERTGNISLDRFIKKRDPSTDITRLSDLINQAKQHRQEQREIIDITDGDENDDDIVVDDEDIISDHECDHEGDNGENIELSNYDDPNF